MSDFIEHCLGRVLALQVRLYACRARLADCTDTEALLAGKHVFVEKPLATRVAEVDELDRLGYSGHVGCEYFPLDKSQHGTRAGLTWLAAHGRDATGKAL